MDKKRSAKSLSVAHRRVNPAQARNYADKADQHLGLARQALAGERWDSAVLLSVHAAINAADAACVKQAGVRSTGESHVEAVRLLTQLFPGDAAARKAGNQLSALVDKKNTVEYEARRSTVAEAQTAMERAERVVRWAQEVIRS
jgi:hypothetical protein